MAKGNLNMKIKRSKQLKQQQQQQQKTIATKQK